MSSASLILAAALALPPAFAPRAGAPVLPAAEREALEGLADPSLETLRGAALAPHLLDEGERERLAALERAELEELRGGDFSDRELLIILIGVGVLILIAIVA